MKPKLVQAILRHSKLSTTMDLYVHAYDEDLRGAVGGHDGGHADAHVEHLVKLRLGHAAASFNEIEDWQRLPGSFAEDDVAVLRQYTGDVVHEAAAGDVG